METTETPVGLCRQCGAGVEGRPTHCPACGVGAPLARPGEPGEGGIAPFLYFLSVAALGGGIWLAFSPLEVVNGDAYNYIIAGVRGVAVVGAGILFAVLGLAARKP